MLIALRLRALSLIILVTATAAGAQNATPQSLSSILLSGPPVMVDGTESQTFPRESGQAVMAPKLRKKVEDGKTAFAVARYEEAENQFQSAYKIAPGNPEINLLLGVTSMAMNKLGQADTYLSRASSLDPRDPATLTAIGILRVKQLDFVSATDPLKIAISLNRKMYLPHLALASAFLGERKFSDALKEAQQAIRWGKSNASQAKFLLAKALVGLGRNKEAARPLLQFLRESPTDPSVKDAERLMVQLNE